MKAGGKTGPGSLPGYAIGHHSPELFSKQISGIPERFPEFRNTLSGISGIMLNCSGILTIFSGISGILTILTPVIPENGDDVGLPEFPE